MSVFRKRGFNEAKKEQKRIEERRAKAGNSLWRFFLKDEEEDVPLRFLTEEPITFYEHSIQNNGKWENVTCIGDGCPHCESGSKSSYKGAWLVVDGREFEYTDKNGKKQTGQDQIRLYVRGSTDIGKLDRLSRKWGLTSRPWFANKTGSGTSTSYELDRGDEEELTEKELEIILAKLPEKYRKHADASDEETLYDIVEDCLFGDVIEGDSPNSRDDDDDEDEDEDDEDVDSGVRGKRNAPTKKTSGSSKLKAGAKKKKGVFKRR